METERSGPWVVTATFCEKVLQEPDGVVTLVRVIDRIIQNMHVTSMSDPVVPTSLALPLVITLKSGSTLGSHMMRLRLEKPSGMRLPDQMFTVLFEGNDRGVNIILNPVTLLVDEEGVYWLDVLIEDQLLTRIPLRLVFQRVVKQA